LIVSNRYIVSSIQIVAITIQRLTVTTNPVEIYRSTVPTDKRPCQHFKLTGSDVTLFISTHSSVGDPKYRQNENSNE